MKREKVRLNIRILKATKERLEAASARLGITETAIMELALQMWLTKEEKAWTG